MQIFISVDKDNRLQGWSTTRSSQSDISYSVQDDHEVLDNPFIFKYENGRLIRDENYRLSKLKNRKINELNQKCNESILSGFTHIINGIEYHFSFDTEAQLNFQGAEKILDKGLVSELEWTVTHNGEYERILISKQIMDELVLRILQHKDENIKRLRNVLAPLVESAQSKEELDKIAW